MQIIDGCKWTSDEVNGLCAFVLLKITEHEHKSYTIACTCHTHVPDGLFSCLWNEQSSARILPLHIADVCITVDLIQALSISFKTLVLSNISNQQMSPLSRLKYARSLVLLDNCAYGGDELSNYCLFTHIHGVQSTKWTCTFYYLTL